MADTKTTGLSAFTPVLTDIMYGVDDPGGTPVSGKHTYQVLMDLFEANMTVPTSVSAAYRTSTILASTTATQGAALIGFDDAAAVYITATDVQNAIDDLDGAVDDINVNLTNNYLTSSSAAVQSRVKLQNAGGDSTAARTTEADSVFWVNWHENGKDDPDNVDSLDLYNVPDGFHTTVQTGVNRTFADTDRGATVEATTAGITLTIDEAATVGIKYGLTLQPRIYVWNSSNGIITVQGDTAVDLDGVTNGSVNVPPGGMGYIQRIAADDWVWVGPKAGCSVIQVEASAFDTDLTTGTAKRTFRMPYAFNLQEVRASVSTAPTGAALQVDINEGGVSILSTVLSIDATEKTSTTAATAAVISDSALADDAEITIDIDQVGSTVAGKDLIVTLIGDQV